MTDYCVCEVPNINPITDHCEVCKKKANPDWFVWANATRFYVPILNELPALGVNVQDGIQAKDKPR